MRKEEEWTEPQIEFLKANYSSARAEDVANALNKTKSSVHHKANRLGLHKDKEAFFETRSKAKSGENAWNFKGYRRKTTRGYIVRYVPDHPNASKDGLVMEHRLVMEEHLGIILPKEFDVHHLNGDKQDNRIENLAVMTHDAHTRFHNRQHPKCEKGRNNPLYKVVDERKYFELKKQGLPVGQIIERLNISRTKYYSFIKEIEA